MYRALTILVAASFLAGTARAQGADVDSARASWITEHLFPLDDVVREGSRPTFLLDSVIGTKIVAFGEPTHGDGAAFEIRNVLTQALHEGAGFGVLALEATGINDLPATFSSQEEARAALDSSASWLWRSSEQARPGLEYAASTFSTSHPLHVVGIDIQHGPATADALLAKVEAAIFRSGIPRQQWSLVEEALADAFANPFAPVDSTTKATVLAEAQEYIRALKGGEPRAAILLESALANAMVPWTRSMEPRDRQMGRNLVYLAGSSNSNEKIVLWAATSHAMRRLSAVDNLDPAWSYDNSITLGDVVADAYADDYYVIAFTACGGSYGAEAIGLERATIDEPPTGSLEALVCEGPFEVAAFVDLRQLSANQGGFWLGAPLVARPLGYKPMRASWPVAIDALIVVREMNPSTLYAR